MSQLPSHTQDSAVGQKIDDPKIRQSARLAWLAPLVGLLATLVLNCAGRANDGSFMGAAGGVIFLVSIAIGLVYSVINWTRIGKYQGVLGHAIGGTLVSTLFALMIALLLPALGSARQVARIMQASSQLEGIQQAFILYSQKHGDYPDSYAALVQEGYIQASYLVMPQQNPPAEFASWPGEQQTEWAIENRVYHFPILGRSPRDTADWRVAGYMKAVPDPDDTRYHLVAPNGLVRVVQKELLETDLERQGLQLE